MDYNFKNIIIVCVFYAMAAHFRSEKEKVFQNLWFPLKLLLIQPFSCIICYGSFSINNLGRMILTFFYDQLISLLTLVKLCHDCSTGLHRWPLFNTEHRYFEKGARNTCSWRYWHYTFCKHTGECTATTATMHQSLSLWVHIQNVYRKRGRI